MKTKPFCVLMPLFFVAMVFAACVIAESQPKPQPTTKWSIAWTNGVDHPCGVIEYDEQRIIRQLPVVSTNYLRDMMAFGEVCKIAGHNWRDGRPGEGMGGYYADYHPNTSFRTCRTCGVCQSQDTSWK